MPKTGFLSSHGWISKKRSLPQNLPVLSSSNNFNTIPSYISIIWPWRCKTFLLRSLISFSKWGGKLVILKKTLWSISQQTLKFAISNSYSTRTIVQAKQPWMDKLPHPCDLRVPHLWKEHHNLIASQLFSLVSKRADTESFISKEPHWYKSVCFLSIHIKRK